MKEQEYLRMELKKMSLEIALFEFLDRYFAHRDRDYEDREFCSSVIEGNIKQLEY